MSGDDSIHHFQVIHADGIAGTRGRLTGQGAEYGFASRREEIAEFAKIAEARPDEREEVGFERTLLTLAVGKLFVGALQRLGNNGRGNRFLGGKVVE